MIVAVLLVCTWGGRELAWTSPAILGMIGVAVVSAVLLVRAERQAPDPVIPGVLVRGATRIYSLIAASANSMVWFGLILLVPLRLQLVLGASATQAGALLTPGIVLGPLSSVAAGQIMARTGRYRATSLLAGVLQMVGAGILLFISPTADQGWILAGYLLAAVGAGFGGPTFMISYQNDLNRKQLGAGVGLFSLCRQFGSSISTAVAGAIVGTGVSEAGMGEAVAGVIQQAFLLPTLAGAAVLISALLIPKTLLRATQREESHEPRAPEVAATAR
jgi:MFS family permease